MQKLDELYIMAKSYVPVMTETFNKLNPWIKGFIVLGIVFYLMLSPVITQLINLSYLIYCVVKTLEAQQTADIEAFAKATNLFLSYFVINIFATFNPFGVFSNMFFMILTFIFVNNVYNIKTDILGFIKKVYKVNKNWIDEIIKFIDSNSFSIDEMIDLIGTFNKKITVN